MDDYPDDWTVREGRAHYFASGGIPADGGYSARWVKLNAGPIPFGIPNSDARRRAVKLHDVHHVLTGYGTSWTGEGEISAWEIASGCGRYGIAWLINLGGLFVGLLIAPGRIRRAFLRGRGARNLYHDGPWDDALLEEPLGLVRARLAFDAPGREVGVRDRLAFLGWASGSVAFAAIVIVLPIVALSHVLRSLV
jgi:hypothetical protein